MASRAPASCDIDGSGATAVVGGAVGGGVVAVVPCCVVLGRVVVGRVVLGRVVLGRALVAEGRFTELDGAGDVAASFTVVDEHAPPVQATRKHHEPSARPDITR
jgi:hypothetical protein